MSPCIGMYYIAGRDKFARTITKMQSFAKDMMYVIH